MTETDAQNLLLGAHIVFLHNRAKLGPLFREIKSRMASDFASFVLCINVPEVATLFRTVLPPTFMDENGNGKFPYRPTSNTENPDRISFSREKTDSGRNPGKFGESGIEIG